MVSAHLLCLSYTMVAGFPEEKAEVTVILRLGLHSCRILLMKAW